MTFSGKYMGTLWYGEGYPLAQRNSALTFEMQIEEADNWFTGVAMDTGGTGASVDEAKVSGIINGIHIEFDKVYKRRHYGDGNGNTIYGKEEGFPIYYNGTYNEDTGFYEGSWEYPVYRRFWFFFKKRDSLGSGRFQLKKMEEE
jgi:hypothetical protein